MRPQKFHKTTVFRQLKNNPPGNFEGLGLEPHAADLFVSAIGRGAHISRQLRPLDVTTKRNYYRAMDFEWDAAKAALNLRKHGVAFEDAARAFLDVGRLEIHDGREDYGEDRWATIGQVYAAVLYVVYTVRHEDSIRIISARRALSHEQKKYREANA